MEYAVMDSRMPLSGIHDVKVLLRGVILNQVGNDAAHRLADDGVDWETPVSIDITGALKEGGNALEVGVTKDTHVGGIYKGVALLEMPADSK